MTRHAQSTCGCGAVFSVQPVGRPTPLCHSCRESRNRIAQKESVKRRSSTEEYKLYMRQKTREWRSRNPDYKSPSNRDGRRASKLRCKFGLSVDDYDALLRSQNEVCAICSRACPTGRRLAVDHCHKTGAVRGLLCKGCNTGIGFLDDDIDRLERAKSYLESARNR